MLVKSKEQQRVERTKSEISSVRFGSRDGIRRRHVLRHEDEVLRAVAEWRISGEKTREHGILKNNDFGGLTSRPES